MNTEDIMTLTCCQDHILTEYIWFVWSKTSYSGDRRRCYRCGTNERTLKIELLSQWKLEAEFRNKRSVDQEGRRQGWYWSMRSSLTGVQREGGEGQNKLLLLCPRRDFSKKCWNQTNTAHHSPLCLPSSLNPCQDPFETYLLHSPLNSTEIKLSSSFFTPAFMSWTG